MQQDNNIVEVIMIRHGQSEYNQKAELLRKKLNIGASWQQYKSNPQFMQFKYCDEMMDCSLSDNGIKQCQQLRNSNQYNDLLTADLILVSPLYRALQTCSLIFKQTQQQTKVIVDPIFSQSLRCSCDVSAKLFEAKEQFKLFDYSKINGKEGEWYIDNQQPQKKAIYYNIIKQNNANSYQSKAKAIKNYMGATYNFEDAHDLIKRMSKAKEQLKKYARQRKSKKIVLVSHFYSIIYMTGTKFNDKGKPIPYPFISNATPMKFNMNLNQNVSSQNFMKPIQQQKGKL